MQTFFLISLFIFGLLFGSFSSVIIHRIKSGEGGIMTGRSHCGSCNKVLQAIDLVPIFSWLLNWGKCRQCKAKVSSIYPILELSTGALFASIGYFLIDYNLIFQSDLFEITKLFFWLLIGFISIIYIFYDILFYEISERVMGAGVFVTSVFLVLLTYSPSLVDTINYIPNWLEWDNGDKFIFYQILLLITVILGLYVILLKELKDIWDILILISLWLITYFSNYYFLGENNSYFSSPIINGIYGALSIFTFFYVQILISGGKWMGGGDLRIAIMVGLLLGTTLAFPGMMLTYFAGSIIGVGFLIYQRIKNKGNKKELETQIPFGPFIAIGFFLAVFFQEQILEFMKIYLNI